MKEKIRVVSTGEKADILLSHLEKLKERVDTVETQYNFSDHNYTRVCEDAILKINHIKSDLKKDDRPAKSDSDLYKRNNLEARFKLGLVAPETYYRQTNTAKNKVEPGRSELQKAVDSTAGGIEFALDKIGDGLIYPFVIVSAGYNLLKRRFGKSQEDNGRHI